MKTQPPLYLTLFCSSLILTACGGGSNGSTSLTPTDTHQYTTLDSTNARAASHLDLLSGHTVQSSEAWQMAYQKYTGFKLNSGISGSGSVSGCIAHQYNALYGTDGKPVASEFEALTKASTSADFDAVSKTSCTEFIEDKLATEIKTGDWLAADYGQGAPTYSAKTDASNGWIIRSSSKNSADQYQYARIKVADIKVIFGKTTSRKARFSVENWDANSASFSTAVNSPELDFSNQRVFWDMETNSVVAKTDNWDVSIAVNGRDYPLQTNGGVSGKGSGGTGILQVANAAAVTDPTNTAQVYKYFADSAEGILSKPGNYGPFEYSVKKEHKMWPTFTTYLIKDNARYYKMQVVSNYGESGTDPSGMLSVRYEELTD